MINKILKKLFNIEIKVSSLCNNIQGFERWFGSDAENKVDVYSLKPIKIEKEWSLIIDEYDLEDDFRCYDIRKINVSGIKSATRIQFMTADNEIFETLLNKDGFYIIDVEPLPKNMKLHARYVSGCEQNVELFISIIRI